MTHPRTQRRIGRFAMKVVGVRYVTVTINSRRQEKALNALKGSGIHVKVNIVFIPGVNDAEIGEIVRFARERGVEIANIMPFIPTPGTYFERFPMVSREALARVRDEMTLLLPQMRHCAQCRADAVGNVLDERPVFVENGSVRELPASSPGARGADATAGASFRFAVASRSGCLVDLHFGHADELLIYDASDSSIRFMERRTVGNYCADKFR